MRTADFHAEKSSGNDPPREDLPAQTTGDGQHRSLPSTDIKLQFVRTVLPAFFPLPHLHGFRLIEPEDRIHIQPAAFCISPAFYGWPHLQKLLQI